MPSWKKVILSGSDAALNSLDVTNNVTATSFTGSLLGTASYADQALTASYVATASYTPNLQQVTSQGNLTTSSIAVSGITSSVNGPLGFPALFKTINGQNTVTIESSGSGGTNAGEAVLRFRDHTGTLPIDGTITYGGNGSDIFVIETNQGSKIQFQGPINNQQFTLYNGGGTGSLIWGDDGAIFIRRTGTSDTRFLGTASYASQALSSSYAVTASFAQNVNPLATASYALQALSSSYALSASYSVNATSASHALNANNAISSSYALSGSYSLTATSASHALNANNAISSSYALSGSYSLTATSASHALNANNAISSSYALSASYASQALSSSYAVTASFAQNVNPLATASYALQALSASYASSAESSQNVLIYVRNQSGYNIAKGLVVRITGSNNSSDIPRIVTASYENDDNSANTLGIASQTINDGSEGYVITEGILTGINTTGYTSGQLIYLGANGTITGSAPIAPLHAVRLGEVVRQQSNNGSIYVRIDNGYELGELHNVVDNTTTSSYGDLLVKSGSVWINSKQLTGSYGLTGSLDATSFTGSLLGTASYAAQALSSSYALSSSHAIFANTASFLPSTTNLNITSISASNAVFQSASIGFLQTVTGSATIIGDAFIILNNNTPTERYAGIIVQDSGSTTTTASFQFDGQTNDWFYEYTDDGGITQDFGVTLFGPEYNTKGSPNYLTANRIPKSNGNHHLNDSNISDNGTTVSINSNTEVTGSLKVTSNITSQTLNVTSGTGSFTGSFTGLFDGISAGQIATGTGTVNTIAKWNTTSSLADSSITDNGSNVRIAVNTTVTGSITNTNSGFKSVVFTSGSSVANATTNGTLFVIDGTIYESVTVDYVVFNSTRTNKRAGTLRSTWDDNTSAIVFDETTTTDIGDTTAFTLDVANNGSGTISVRATNNVGSAMTIIYEYKLLG